MTEEEAKNSSVDSRSTEYAACLGNNDTEVRQLWKTMNGWVYAGFDELRRTNNGSDIINKPKTDGIANVRIFCRIF